MYSALLKNKWPLLAFLVITLAGLQAFLGENSEIARQQQLAPAAELPPPPPPRTENVVERMQNLDGFYGGADAGPEQAYVDDEELIDTTEGFDPTPPAEELFGDEAFEESSEDEGAFADDTPR